MLDQASADGGSDVRQDSDAMLDRGADGGSDANMLCFAPSDFPPAIPAAYSSTPTAAAW